MKKVISMLCVIIFCFCLTACDNSGRNESRQTNQNEAPRSDSTKPIDDVDESKTLTTIDLLITVGEKTFSGKFYDNQTTRALVGKFPLAVDMSELNGNEKYHYLSTALPTNSQKSGEIHTGDIMLYDDNCLVVFYETFSSTYNYTHLGYIEDAASFAQVVGEGNIKVTFNLKNMKKIRRINNMNKKVLVISTSLRKGGNSDTLADEFIRGAKEAGNNVEKICLEGKTIAFCKGCLVCQKTQKCVIKDDADNIAQKVKNADVIVFATPIYYYEMSGQMKTLLDRLNPLFTSDYTFREVYMIATAADENLESVDVAVKGLEGWIACFDKSKLSGVLRGVGVTDIGDIQHHEKLMSEAYEMGKF